MCVKPDELQRISKNQGPQLYITILGSYILILLNADVFPIPKECRKISGFWYNAMYA
jgi:hypothetical protein